MKSIRSRLLLWILSGVILLIGLSGGCIYFTVRHVLLSEVDDELQQARKVVYNLFENDALEHGVFVDGVNAGRRLRLRDEERWREFDFEDGELLYQLRDTGGEVILRSPSLGERTMEGPAEMSDPRKTVSLELADGSRLRARIDLANPRKWPEQFAGRRSSEGAQVEIIVARDVSEIGRSLLLLLVGIGVAGFLAAGATALLVTVALRQGLSPLDKLGIATAGVDASTLETRFDEEEMPPELLPICERLNGLMARLESSFERERRFSSDLAHELRTPIAELRTMAEAAILFPDKVPHRQFEKIRATARGMQEIVENLLSLARWEQGSSELSLEEVALAGIIEEAWEPYAGSAREKGLSVRLAILPEHRLTTDVRMFRHILNNLFSNALEYTPEGGAVTVESLAESDGSPLGILVCNSVAGIEPPDLPHLFERFWRRDTSRSGGDHSGLGLSIARACAEALSMDLDATLKGDLICFALTESALPAEASSRFGRKR